MSLEEIRQEINKIDAGMKELFLKRMECSRQVAEEKKKTKARVYVPKREEEVIAGGLADVPEDQKPEYKMFLKQVMAISRTYQYSRLKLPDNLENTLDFSGNLLLEFSCKEDSDQLFSAVAALKTAGLVVHGIQTKKCQGRGICCRMEVSGDFRIPLARGAVLQIYEENENVSAEKIAEP